MDPLKEQFEKFHKARFKTFVCESCERYFFALEKADKILFCPFCGNPMVYPNDDFTVEGKVMEN